MLFIFQPIYTLNKKEANWPVFLFMIDISVDPEELQELKESIQNSLIQMPKKFYSSVKKRKKNASY